MRDTTTVLVCRDCCCGNANKHPDVAHDEHLLLLSRAARAAGGRVLVTRCLDVCSRSNVVVVRHRGPAGTRTIWLGGILTHDRVELLAAWLAAGGARGAAPLPARLALRAFAPTESSASCALREERAASGR